MLLSLRNPKFIFIHIPKTAGTSVSVALLNKCTPPITQGCLACDWDYHTTAKQFKHRLSEYDNLFKFAFVRNPWARMYSYCAMFKRHPPTNYEFKIWLLEGDHVMENTHLNETPIGLQRRSQISWVTDEHDNIIVDFVGRVETLDKDYKYVCDRIGVQYTKLGRERRSKHGDYHEGYDQETIDFVATHFYKDIKEFNYEY